MRKAPPNIEGMNLSEETRHIQSLFTKPAGHERIGFALELFKVLLDSKHVLKQNEFRKVVKNKIIELYGSIHHDRWVSEFLPVITPLCKKIGVLDGRPFTAEACGLPESESESDTESDSEPKNLGAGGFGMVFSPALTNTNENVRPKKGKVTKVFYRRSDLADVLETEKLLSRIMGPDPGHRISPYKTQKRGRNLTKKQRNVLGTHVNSDASVNSAGNTRTKTVKGRYRKGRRIHVVRMPYLGVDLTKISKVYKDLRKIPVWIIFGQIVKMLTQVNNIEKNKYVHGDIRSTNIMVEPSTGTFTIIDFDWFKPATEFIDEYSFGFYNNPPEFLLYSSLEDIAEELKTRASVKDITDHMPREARYIEGMNIDFKYLTSAKHILGQANRDNITYLAANGMLNNAGFLRQLSQFDAFGLAHSLIELFSVMYPTSINPAISEPSIKGALSTRITNGDAPYTDAELGACTHAIVSLVRNVLMPLGDFKIENRISINEGLERAKAIEAELATAVGVPVFVFAPASDSSASVSSSASAKGGMRKSKQRSRGVRKTRKTEAS